MGGQWGETKTEQGVRFVLHINTEGSNPIRPDSVIDYLGFLDNVDDTLEKKILNKYIGKLYLKEIA